MPARKSQSIAYSLNESEHIYWILDLEGEVHSVWDLWISGLQEVRRTAGSFWSGLEYLNFLFGQFTLPESTSPKILWEEFNVPLFQYTWRTGYYL